MPPSRSAWNPGQRLLTAGLVFMVTGVGFEGLAVPTVLPATLDELPGLALYGWAFSGFWLANLVGIALAGAQADRRGPLLPFMVGAAAFAVGLVAAGLAPSMEWVVAGRVVQGLGSGAISAITYVAIARGYDPGVQPRMIAVISTAWVLPGVVGPALAGWVTEELSWRWIFLGLAPLLPFAALAVARPLAAMRRVPPADGAPRGDGHAVRDTALLALGAGGVLAAISWLHPIGSPVLAGVGGLVAYRPLRRLLPPGTLTLGSEWGAAVAVVALLSFAFFGVEAFLPLAVASVRNAGTIAGGLALTAAALTWAAGSWIQARLATRRSRRSVTSAGLVLVAAGILLATLVPISSVPPVAVAALAWAVAGLGMGLAYATATLAIIESAPAGEEGAASASFQLSNAIGVAVGTGLAGGIVALSASGGLGLAPGIAIANLGMVVACGLGVIAARRMSPRAAPPAATTAEHAPAPHHP